MATREEIAAIFVKMAESFVPEKASGINATIQFDLSGDNGGLYWVKIENGTCASGEGAVDPVSLTVKTPADTWYNIALGNVNVMQAFMGGKLKVQGDMSLGMKLQSIFAL